NRRAGGPSASAAEIAPRRNARERAAPRRTRPARAAARDRALRSSRREFLRSLSLSSVAPQQRSILRQPARGTNSRRPRAGMRGQKKRPYNGVPAENRGIARRQPKGETHGSSADVQPGAA